MSADPIRQHTEKRLAAAFKEVLAVLEELGLPDNESALDKLIPSLKGGRRRTAQLALLALAYLRQAFGRLEDNPVAAVSSALLAGAYVEAIATGFHLRASQARGGRGRAHPAFRAWARQQAARLRAEASPRRLSTKAIAELLKRQHPDETAGRSVTAICKQLTR